jgi:hypothetical protein
LIRIALFAEYQAAAWRSEVLELVIVVLVFAEILLTLLGY